MGLTNWAAGLAVAIGMAAPALADDGIAGFWRQNADTKYLIEMCGADGTGICISAVELAGKADTAENRAWLNRLLMDGGKPAGKNTWKGTLSLFGHSGEATVKLKNPNLMEIGACAYVVLCKTIEMSRSE